MGGGNDLEEQRTWIPNSFLGYVKHMTGKNMAGLKNAIPDIPYQILILQVYAHVCFLALKSIFAGEYQIHSMFASEYPHDRFQISLRFLYHDRMTI